MTSQFTYKIPERTTAVLLHSKFQIGFKNCPYTDTLLPLAYLVWNSPRLLSSLTGVPGTASLDFSPSTNFTQFADWLTGKTRDPHAKAAPPMLVILDRMVALRGRPMHYAS